MLKFIELTSLLCLIVTSTFGHQRVFQAPSPIATIQQLITRSTSFNGKNPDSIRYYARQALYLGEASAIDSLKARAETNLGVSFLYPAS